MTAVDEGKEHDKRLCLGKKRMKQRPGAKTGKNPVFDDAGNELCTRPAGWGTSHPGIGKCKLHGGNTPDHVTHGQKERARQAVATFGLPRQVDPRDALLEEVYRTAGAVDWLHQQVQALRADDVIWGKAEEVEKQAGEFPGTDTTSKAAVHVWVQLWQAERAHLVKVAKEAISAGIEERRVRLAEQQGALLAGAIRAILGDLDLSPEQQTRAAQVVPFRLREVAAAA
ncbi:hypothetical protein O7626_39985 [Micromonospora sp. WMMD1102]|uniref:hypothetical protein n=1 Tax=Micromonospora sp. WMMD1102 TaxID=3016105 RepID=UPI00241593F8|nr:hypothetical protein [Micromonospora sp. WMMD1102]MDG4791997.1 hypothetical protein [Micromonospora sp. WMMD1102]